MTNQNIDKLKAVLPSIDTLTELRNISGELHGACPNISCGSDDDAFRYNPNEQKGYCRQCTPKGDDVIGWHCKKYNTTFKDLLIQHGISEIKTPTKDINALWSRLPIDDKILDYLVNKRKLHQDIVKQAINDNIIKFSSSEYYGKRDCLVVAYRALNDLARKENVYSIQYISMSGDFIFNNQSINGDNKRFKAGTDQDNGFVQFGKSIELVDSVILTEGVIDALSGAQVLPDYCFIALGSASYTKKLEQFKNSNIKKAIVFQDHDEAGTKLLNNCHKVLKSIGIEVFNVEWSKDDPKDINDLLKLGQLSRIKEMVASAKLFKPIKPKKSKPEVIKSDLPNQDTKSNDIELKEGYKHEILQQVQKILLSDNNFYQQNNKLHKIDKIKTTETTYNIKPVSKLYLMNYLNEICNFQKFTLDGVSKKDCPNWLPEAILNDDKNNCRYRYISGVKEIPLFKLDGTILSKSGYDAETGLYLELNNNWNIPEAPTKDDALKAYEALNKPISLYNFTTEAERVATISGMLTACIRDSLPTAPAFFVDAPKAGSGKTKLSVLMCYFTGITNDLTFSNFVDDEELDKLIGAKIKNNKKILLIDNVNNSVSGGGLLNALLTAGNKAEPRILGESELITHNAKMFIVLNGNAARLIGDITRRVLKIRIDPLCSNPHEKRFPFLPDEYVKQHKKELIEAALTIIKAYYVAGCPKQDDNEIGSFEQWNKSIRCPLLWLGKADPYETIKDLQANDTERDLLLDLLKSWYLNFGCEAKTTKDVINYANDFLIQNNNKEYLKNVIDDIALDKKANIPLGNFISKYKDRIEGNYRFKIVGKKNRATIYKIDLIDLAKEKKSIQ